MSGTRELNVVERRSLDASFGVPLALLGFSFCLSGAAALIYQVTWQRILALHTGVGLYSVAMIVGAFMLGLGLGSHLGGALSSGLRRRTALGLFAAVELAVAAFGVVSCDIYYDWLSRNASLFYASRALSGLTHFLSLLVPTSLMGMSLPFLAQAAVSDVRTAGKSIGYLYGLNVLGASVGALATPWVLIRQVGLRHAITAAVLLNLLAGLTALLLARAPSAEIEPEQNQDPRPAAPQIEVRFSLWLLLHALSGFCALALEVVWFRVVDVAVRSTAFTFGTVLSTYLLGVAVGSLLGTRLLGRLRHPLKTFLACQCALLLYSGAALFLLAELPIHLPGYAWFFHYWSNSGPEAWFELGSSGNPGQILRLYLILPLALYGLPTVLMGFSFCVLQQAVHDDTATAGRKVGFLQAANLAGNVAGSLLVGMTALHFLGTTGTLRLLLACGILFALVGLGRYGARSPFMAAAALLSLLLAVFPGQRKFWLRLHGHTGEPTFIEEDATSVVALRPDGGSWRVLVNGKRHSWLPFGGIHSWLGALPAVLHPAPHEVAIVGLGSGDTAWAAGAREETGKVTVWEIAAPQLRLLRAWADQVPDDQLRRFLDDPRVTIHVEDGRTALLGSTTLYDVIVVDALVPTSAYSGNLYSVDFYKSCASKLKPGGLMATWVPTPRVSVSFRTAFPHVVNVRDGEFMLGSNRPIPLRRRRWRERLRSERVASYLGPYTLAEVEYCLDTVRPSVAPDFAEPNLNRDLFPRDEFNFRPWK